jgi:hypothetical protein
MSNPDKSDDISLRVLATETPLLITDYWIYKRGFASVPLNSFLAESCPVSPHKIKFLEFPQLWT